MGITAIPSYINKGLKAIPGLRKLKMFGRGMGLLGMLVDIGASLVNSIHTLNFMGFVRTLSVNLIAVDQGLVNNVSALKAGASGLAFWYNTWGIYSKLWFIFFITGIIVSYLMKAHFGDQVPKYQLYLVVFVMFLTPVSIIGNIIDTVVNQGKFTRKDLYALQVWKGLRMTFTNIDLWVSPVLDALSGFLGGSPTGSPVNVSTGQNLSNGSGVTTLGG